VAEKLWGVVVKTLFVPTLGYGMSVTVQCLVIPANGQWIVFRLDFDLASQMPHGPWFCTLYLYKGGPQPVVP